MKLAKMYAKYKIPPNLQEHQLRVAAVGLWIKNHWSGEKVDWQNLILMLLIHDMGNIIKFDLKKYAHFLGDEEKNLDYWLKVQRKFVEKFGDNEHVATVKIALELNLDSKVVDWLKRTENPDLEKVSKQEFWEMKLHYYCDVRIGPFGVLSVNERFADLKKRYATKRNLQRIDHNHKWCLEIEKQIQNNLSTSLSQIKDEAISEFESQLKDFEV